MTVVLSADLVPLLEPTIARIGIEALAKRARAVEGFVKKADAYYKRLTEARSGRTVTVNANMADVLLLACEDDPGRLASVPHFPSSRSEAFHMIEAHLDARGEQMTPGDHERLTESLIHFTQGLRDDSLEASEVAQAYLARGRDRHAHRKAQQQALAA